MHKLATFAVLWLAVGFVTGTATLLGPVRWITDHGRSSGWSDSAESWAVRAVIAAFVLGSAAVSLWLTRIATRTLHRHVRVALHTLAFGFAVATVALWLDPAALTSTGGLEAVGSRFTFGPYPEAAELARLEREGYTGVISLLHPAVVPFETKLIADERAAVSETGLEFIHVPMLPWISDNATALSRIGEIAARPEGHYYVHCYLGKDRVRLVKRHVEELLGTEQRVASAAVGAHIAARVLTDGKVLTRGSVVQVDEGVWLAPFPTDDELMSWVLPGLHGPVVSLLDPALAEDLVWIERERQLLEANGVGFTLLPLPIDPYDPARALEVARAVAAMPRPVFVHAFLGLDTGRSPAAEAFVHAFRSDRPSLPASLFGAPLVAGSARVVSPHVAVGPRPAPEDFQTLKARGVRELLFVADGEAEDVERDRTACEEHGLTWRGHTGDLADAFAPLKTGGPWYVYGPRAEMGTAHFAAGVPARTAEATDPVSPQTDAGPSARLFVLLAPVLSLFAGVAAAVVGWLRQSHAVRTAYTRKLFHFAIFTTAGVLHLTVGLPGVMLFGGIVSCLVVYAVWRGDGFAFYEALARPSDAPRRSLFVLVPLVTTAVGGLSANLLFGAWAFVGYLVAGWGDAVAEPVGTAWGRHRYRVPSIGGVAASRSLEGSLAVCLVGGLAAMCGLVFAGIGPLEAAGVALACGIAAAIVEAVSHHGLDNLTVQLAAAGMAALLLA